MKSGCQRSALSDGTILDHTKFVSGSCDASGSTVSTSPVRVPFFGGSCVGVASAKHPLEFGDCLLIHSDSLGQPTSAQADTRPPEAINLVEHRIHRKRVLSGLTHEYPVAA